ncbi:V-type ATP synthase subunit C, partial [mine drainage metagenome]
GDIESISKYLVKIGYGVQMMRYIEEYRKTGDLSILLYSLDLMNYEKMFDALKFFRGDEGAVMRYFQARMDERNVMILMKAFSLKMPFDLIRSGLLPYGTLKVQKLEEFFEQIKGGSDHVKMIEDLIGIQIELQKEDQINLTVLEQKIQGSILKKYIELLSTQANSLGSIFSVMLRTENERNNLRKIINGKVYGFEPSKIRELLITV